MGGKHITKENRRGKLQCEILSEHASLEIILKNRHFYFSGSALKNGICWNLVKTMHPKMHAYFLKNMWTDKPYHSLLYLPILENIECSLCIF